MYPTNITYIFNLYLLILDISCFREYIHFNLYLLFLDKLCSCISALMKSTYRFLPDFIFILIFNFLEQVHNPITQKSKYTESQTLFSSRRPSHTHAHTKNTTLFASARTDYDSDFKFRLQSLSVFLCNQSPWKPWRALCSYPIPSQFITTTTQL